MSPAGPREGRGRERRTVETHISVVTLTARHAFKRKKPLHLWGLLDYSTPALRRHWCEEELRLNRRLAPDVYLRVARLGPYREPVVVMRRFADADTLSERLASGRAGAADLRALGERLRRFHTEHPLEHPSGSEGVRAFARVVHGNLRATAAAVPQLFPLAVHRRLERRLASALLRLRRQLRQRFTGGWAVEGHGDLRLEHVVIEADGSGSKHPKLSVVDCVEFNADLRRIDALSDLAFLVMDLQAHGHAALVPPLLEGYGAGGDPAPLALFCAYRAHVRAKVAAVTCGEADLPAERRRREADGARCFLSLALAHGEMGQAPPALLLLRGFSGSGKSRLAADLAPWLLADWHRADVLRKRLHGLDPLARLQGEERQRLYGEQAHARTEDALATAARASLQRGRWVLLDATHLRRASRRRAIELADGLGVPWWILDLATPWPVIEQRLAGRGGAGSADPSDADRAVALEQRRWAEPLTEEERRRSVAVPVERTTGELLMELWERRACAG